ncbi:uncharacterized protein ColSpa_12269 [Colletotrichum spaethianum]|uniref:SnoaL-like domain-containing protein n=1 Tax=Colletotrichum spaethianum TaxID=700344 RepID=A0AA37PGV2_9PEZI|nr:uncharacterized protein ColSpa_12269 [Colletotrichum spaethianum]GKT52088.1 hypothetical protein ColSpa_12269 [Colletotrichum spaethianum]
MAPQGVVAIAQAFLDAANNKNWEEVQNHLHPDATVTYNRNQESRDDFVKRLTAAAEKGDQLTADTWTVDEAAQSLGARLVISSVNSAEGGAPSQVWDLILIFFKDGKISRFYQVASQFSRGHAGPCAPAVTSKPSENPLSASEFRKLYPKYIHTVDHGDIATDMPQYWTDPSSTNGLPLSMEKNIGFLVSFVKPLKAGLEHKIEEVIIDAERQQIAARVVLEGVPEDKRVQMNGPGEKAKIYETALYGYEEGKIAWIWTAWDFHIELPAGPPGNGGGH